MNTINNDEYKIPFLTLSIENSTIIRGVAILLVVFGHLDYTSWSGAGGVALFLVLSGYGLERSFQANGAADYWKKRIINVYVPYVLISLFNIIAWRVYFRRIILFSLLGLDFSCNIDASMWYISFLFYWYFCYYVVCRLSGLGNKYGNWVRILGISAAIVPCWYLCKTPVWHKLSGAEHYILAFPLGVILCRVSSWKLKRNNQRLIWAVILFVCSAYMFRVYKDDYDAVYALSMSAQVLAISQLFSLNQPCCRIFHWLGKYAFAIYLVEYMLIQVKDNWFYRLSYRPLIDFACICFIILVAYLYWEGVYKILAGRLSGAERK